MQEPQQCALWPEYVSKASVASNGDGNLAFLLVAAVAIAMCSAPELSPLAGYMQGPQVHPTYYQ